MADNVYVSITFGNIPRDKADEIVQNVEELAEGYDISVDWGSPIGADDPTPIADEAADAVNPDTPSTPLSDAPVDTPAPVVPDVDPTPNGTPPQGETPTN